MTRLFFVLVFVASFVGCGFKTDPIIDARNRGAEKGYRNLYDPKCIMTTPEWSPLREETAQALDSYKEGYLSTCRVRPTRQ